MLCYAWAKAQKTTTKIRRKPAAWKGVVVVLVLVVVVVWGMHGRL